MKKVLFLLKERTGYGSYGLIISCRFVIEALRNFDLELEQAKVVDANGIDREVHKFRPNFVIIEAIWVTPAKLQELVKLHPNVRFIIRVHSHVPFLATEGMALEWLIAYQEIKNVVVAANDERMVKELNYSLDFDSKYLPNIYDVEYHQPRCKEPGEIINIGAFGALRIMKNNLQEAVAALIFAKKHNKIIHFHINRPIENNDGNAVLKNLRNIFKNGPHKLIEHSWYSHEDFIQVIRRMDIGMQISFSETFNIIAADFISNNIPLIASSEIAWLNNQFSVDCNDAFKIADKIHYGLRVKDSRSKLNLQKFNENSIKEWLDFLLHEKETHKNHC